MMIFTAVSVLAWLGFYLWYLLAYNHLVALNKTCGQAWAHVDVELQRRHDLIGNLVTVVKAYARHEETVLLQTVRARQAGPLSVAEANQAGHDDARHLSGLFALVEQYPQLKADTQFTQLQQALIDTENRIAERRSAYNQCVNRYETLRTTIPTMVVAWAGRFRAQGFFDAQDETAAVVRVNLA